MRSSAAARGEEMPQGGGRGRGCPGLREFLLLVLSPLTGREVCVLLHPDPYVRRLRGRVVAETSRCLIVEDPEGARRSLTKVGLFAFKLGPRCWAVLRGEEILGSPAERLKRLERKGVGWLVRARQKRGYTGCEASGEDVQRP